MAYITAEARQQLLDDLAGAIEALGDALAALGAAYELLDEQTADRMEEQLFRPVQQAYGRAQRTHSELRRALLAADAHVPAGPRRARSLGRAGRCSIARSTPSTRPTTRSSRSRTR